jgi:hypothetical protein
MYKKLTWHDKQIRDDIKVANSLRQVLKKLELTMNLNCLDSRHANRLYQISKDITEIQNQYIFKGEPK